MTSTRVRRPRAPRPWWFRLGAWVIALGVVLSVVVAVASSSSYGTTEHTQRNQPLTLPRTALPSSLTELETFPATAQLSGPVVLEVNDTGVDARRTTGGKVVWSYHRTDAPLCASSATGSRMILMYGDGTRCNEAVALELATGKRAWSRTIEAAGPNEIIWQEGTFLSVDEQKVILYEPTQGFERFTFNAVDTRFSEGQESTCQQLDAAGTILIGTLQRCRSSSGDPWSYQVVVNSVNDGKPLEMGRTVLTLPDPQLLAVMPDGTSLLRSGETVYAAAVGTQSPIPVAGLAVADDVTVEATGAGALITTGGTAYALGAPYAQVSWSRPVLATPSLRGGIAYLLSEAGIETVDMRSGQTASTSALVGELPAGAELKVDVSGPVAGITGSDGLTIYA
ncbi:hypothetical protein EK0264_15695 [Epidermidibacterium keratini]|uniref:PQQ-binding-like beta-propeller repeat protein n=1 Tax=Epidermidibacterium keratini TaxID=1891644 RepID=A0A7L4YRA5_9ACTN|nr:hypothetical protein [Epidermidibacterium keratini]QHC01592.1 hypothetical protein EK0264_15695 [Epidermidibacterium keratini]